MCRKITTILLLSVLLVSCGRNKESTAESSSDSAKTTNTPEAAQTVTENQMGMPKADPSYISFQVFNNDTTVDKNLKGFGYNILNDGNIYVHQPSIPAVSGNRAFISESDAKKAASLVVDKVKKGILPPTISVDELDSLGIK